MNRVMPSFLDNQDLQLLLFGGKGGSGKALCAAAAAERLSALHPERSLLLVSTTPGQSARKGLPGYEAGGKLEVLELDSLPSLTRLRGPDSGKLRETASIGTFFDGEDIDQFLSVSLPGADELMALCEICSWVETRRYDCVVVDTAPSGDTLRLLAMPELIRRWLGMLEVLLGKRRYLRRVFDRSGGPEHLDFLGTGWKATLQLTEKLLRDPARTQFVLVTTADPASIRETAALWKDFETQRMPVSQLVVNQLHLECYCPPCKAAEAAEQLEIGQLVEAVEDSCPVWGVGLQPDGVDGQQRTMEFWDRAHPMDRRPQIAARDN